MFYSAGVYGSLKESANVLASQHPNLSIASNCGCQARGDPRKTETIQAHGLNVGLLQASHACLSLSAFESNAICFDCCPVDPSDTDCIKAIPVCCDSQGSALKSVAAGNGAFPKGEGVVLGLEFAGVSDQARGHLIKSKARCGIPIGSIYLSTEVEALLQAKPKGRSVQPLQH